jgi:hypothetical protein
MGNQQPKQQEGNSISPKREERFYDNKNPPKKTMLGVKKLVY